MSALPLSDLKYSGFFLFGFFAEFKTSFFFPCFENTLEPETLLPCFLTGWSFVGSELRMHALGSVTPSSLH